MKMSKNSSCLYTTQPINTPTTPGFSSNFQLLQLVAFSWIVALNNFFDDWQPELQIWSYSGIQLKKNEQYGLLWDFST